MLTLLLSLYLLWFSIYLVIICFFCFSFFRLPLIRGNLFFFLFCVSGTRHGSEYVRVEIVIRFTALRSLLIVFSPASAKVEIKKQSER